MNNIIEPNHIKGIYLLLTLHISSYYSDRINLSGAIIIGLSIILGFVIIDRWYLGKNSSWKKISNSASNWVRQLEHSSAILVTCRSAVTNIPRSIFIRATDPNTFADWYFSSSRKDRVEPGLSCSNVDTLYSNLHNPYL